MISGLPGDPYTPSTVKERKEFLTVTQMPSILVGNLASPEFPIDFSPSQKGIGLIFPLKCPFRFVCDFVYPFLLKIRDLDSSSRIGPPLRW